MEMTTDTPTQPMVDPRSAGYQERSLQSENLQQPVLDEHQSVEEDIKREHQWEDNNCETIFEERDDLEVCF